MESETLEEEMEDTNFDEEGLSGGTMDQLHASIPSNDSLLSCENQIRNSSLFHLIQDGFQLKNSYEHSKKLTELVDVTYNPRTKQFIFLDTRGITTWYKDGIGHTVSRSMTFPKYQNKLLRNIIYARKYNVYFCLAKDFSLKVLNKNFEETCNIDSDLSSVMFLLFNPVRDELITGGVKGTKVWEFRQVADEVWREIKPMANYKLFLTKELESVKGSWIKKVELNEQFQHIYCCSDTSVQCYDMDGKLLFEIERAHDAQINACKYSPQARLLITCSNDHEVKVWTLNGGLINVFRSHTKPVTDVVLHPHTSMIVLTSSLDGSIKIWSLDIMELLYSMVASTVGIHWMGLTGEGQLWTATLHDLSLWSINEVVNFYALARCRTTSLQVAQLEHKTSRVVAVGEDSSVRLVSMKDQKNLSTVLPPPSVSPLTQVLSVTYNRQYSLVYLLVNPTEIWVYTMKTDPACRTAVWDVMKIQEWNKTRAQSARVHPSTPLPVDKKMAPTQRASSAHFKGFRIRSASAEGPPGVEMAAPCCSLLALHSHIQYWGDHGFVCPRKTSLLLLGLEDGRILFMDPVIFGIKICELQACKDAILDMQRDHYHDTLVIRSHLREEDLFQFWSLPELQLMHEALVTPDTTGHARLGKKLFTGHSDGAVQSHELQSVSDDPHAGLRHTGLSLTKIGSDNNPGLKEHTGPVVGMDACPDRGIFVSCSADAIIKVWNCNKTLLTEITLSQTLSTAKFLNAKGDLLIGYLNHLFLIDHTKVLPYADQSIEHSEDTFETESEIYEDPAVKYEGAAANPDPLDLDNYLVPFNLDLTQRFLAGEASPSGSVETSDVENEDDTESQFSHAATEVYQSPTATPRRLSVVDMLVASDAINTQAIKENKEVYSLRRKQSSRRHSFHGRKDGTCGSFEFPSFGHSPGPSPTPTPPSTPSDISVSDISSESEEEEKEETGKPEEQEPLLPTERISIIERKPPSQPSDTAPVKDNKIEEPRYGFSTMKIDSKALLNMRKSPSSATLKKPSAPSQVSVDVQSSEKSRPSTGKSPIKKKEQKKNRTRVGHKSSEEGTGTGKIGSSTQKAELGATAQLSTKQIERKAEDKILQTKNTSKGPAVGMSTIELDGPVGKDRAGAPDAAARAKKPVVPQKKKKKQPILSRAGRGTDSKRQSSNEKDLADSKTTEDSPNEAHEETKTEEGSSLVATSSAGGLGAMAMFKAANKLQISQKYGPEQAKISVVPAQADDTENNEFQSDEQRSSLAVTYEMHAKDHAGSSQHDDGQDAGVPMEDQWEAKAEEAHHRIDKEDGGSEVGDENRKKTLGSKSITSGRSMSAKEGRVRFNIPSQRAQSAAPRLAGGGVRAGLLHPSGLDNDAFSMLSSVDRTNSEDELADIPESRLSVFDDTDFNDSPTPPNTNFSVSIISKASTRQSSLPESRMCSGLSRFEMDSPFCPMRLPFSPLTAPSPLSDRFLDEEGQGLLAMERGNVVDDVDSIIDVAPVNYNRAIPFSAPPEGRRARPNTAERRREEQRPQTAGADPHVTFQNEDFGSMTEEQFQKHLDVVSTPTDLSGYLKNDGLQLDKNWTDRMIQRHQFLKMQKDQRAKSAADRRQLLELRQRQRRKALLGHRHCSSSLSPNHQSENLLQSDTIVRSKRSMRAKSAPANPARHLSSQSRDTHSALDQWKQASFSRNTTQQPSSGRLGSASTQHQQAFDPYSCCTDQRIDHTRIDRTLSGSPTGLDRAGWNQRSSSPGGRQSSLGKGEQHSLFHDGHPEPRQSTCEQNDQKREHSKTRLDLAAEKPYRFRFNSSKSNSTKSRDEVPDDVVTRDSSSNHLVVKKKQSAKSIPSKPRRYVLVHQPGTKLGVLVPSILEEQLLAKRFPKMHKRWQRVAPPPEDEINGSPPPPQRKNSLNPSYVNPLPTNHGSSPTMM
ncbi:uncharacterized protein LOC129257363 [Lytechinus pictus]|uniref:uncharacterized protein LOC129257363 n=1 Tax=Lytechinus pictus TaxID=7653 RepID=UPI0030BA2AE1